VLELAAVEHDPDKNIWLFSYMTNPLVPSSGFGAAVNGESGELLRMWVD
jgi:hypothetical protein